MNFSSDEKIIILMIFIIASEASVLKSAEGANTNLNLQKKIHLIGRRCSGAQSERSEDSPNSERKIKIRPFSNGRILVWSEVLSDAAPMQWRR